MRFRPIVLADAVRSSLDTLPIVKTVGNGVEIERTTFLDPEINRRRIIERRAEFDPQFRASYEGGQFDQPPNSFLAPGLETETRFDEGTLNAAITKKWHTGTTASIAYDPSLSYLFFPRTTTSGFNPSYSSRFSFELRQPLLRGGGRDANLAEIRIAVARSEQSDQELQEAILSRIRSVEEVYWKLKANISAWQIFDSVMPLAAEVVRIEELRIKSERSIYSDLARAKVNLESLKRRQELAWNEVRQSELRLRELIGLPTEDAVLLIPADMPETAFAPIDASSAIDTALAKNPQLQQSRARLFASEYDSARATNETLPQLDVYFRYRVAGLADRLDNSFDQLGSFDYSDWIVGAEYELPFGNRRARAAADAADLLVAKQAALFAAEQQRIAFSVASQIAEIETDWNRFESARRQLAETDEWVRVAQVRFFQPPPGHGKDSLLLALLDYETAINRHVDSVALAAELMASYQTGKAKLAETQGTGLDQWQVVIEGGEKLSRANVPFHHAPTPSSYSGHSIFSGYRQ